MDFHCLSAGKTFLVTFLWEQFDYVFREHIAVFSYEMRGQELSLYWSLWLNLDLQRPRLWSIGNFKIRHIIGMYWGLPGGAVVNNPPANAGDARDLAFDPWVGKIPWSRKWQPALIFLLGNSMDKGVWWVTVHEVPKSWTWMSYWACTYRDV